MLFPHSMVMGILADAQGSGGQETLQRALQSPALALGSIFMGLVMLPKEPDEQAPATPSSSHLVSHISAHMQRVKTGKIPICKKCC